MRRCASCIRLLTAALLATGVSFTPADEVESWADQLPARLAAFTLDCFIPTTPDTHTRATLVAKITLENRTVFTVASCADCTSPARWPEFDEADGPVLGIDIGVTTVLEDGTRHPMAWNHCWMHSNKGYLTFRCGADERGGEVHVLVSIAP